MSCTWSRRLFLLKNLVCVIAYYVYLTPAPRVARRRRRPPARPRRTPLSGRRREVADDHTPQSPESIIDEDQTKTLTGRGLNSPLTHTAHPVTGDPDRSRPERSLLGLGDGVGQSGHRRQRVSECPRSRLLTTAKSDSTRPSRCSAPPPRPGGDSLPGAELRVRLRAEIVQHQQCRLQPASERCSTRGHSPPEVADHRARPIELV